MKHVVGTFGKWRLLKQEAIIRQLSDKTAAEMAKFPGPLWILAWVAASFTDSPGAKGAIG
jgi:hypothetical protein